MSYNFCGKEVSGRFAFPSGEIATTIDTAALMLRLIPSIGVYVGKSTTIKPREGNHEDIIVQLAPDTYCNAVGYANPGLDEMIEEFARLRQGSRKDVFLMPQIGEDSPENFRYCIEQFEKRGNVADGYELNLSCPHAKAGGILIGTDPNLVFEIVRACREITNKPIFVKITAAAPSIEDIVLAAEKAGATGASLINTLRIDQPELYNTFGGMSGAQLFDVAHDAIKRVKAVTKMQIIGMGGISSASQIMKLDESGENNFYAIGTALAGMSTPEIVKYFEALEYDLKIQQQREFCNSAEGMVHKKMVMEYRPFTVEKVTRYGDEIALIKFREYMNAGPGKFVFVKPDNKHSKPFSVANDMLGLEIVVRGIGETSRKLIGLKPNDVVRVRGPYGADLNLRNGNPMVFIGCGCGVAPIYHAAMTRRQGKNIFFLGARTKEELVFHDRFEQANRGLYVSTDDGTLGMKGNIVELLRRNIYKTEFAGAEFFVCGPEVAMKGVHEIITRITEPSNIRYLVERMTKCGVGICGSCATPEGYRACVDGPVFTAETFVPGQYTRNASGQKIGIGVKR